MAVPAGTSLDASSVTSAGRSETGTDAGEVGAMQAIVDAAIDARFQDHANLLRLAGVVATSGIGRSASRGLGGFLH